MKEYPDFSPCITSETVIHNMGAYITMPALAIEESIDTNLISQGRNNIGHTMGLTTSVK